MLSGETVTVFRPTIGGYDRLGNPTITGYTSEVVPNVLIAPGATEDMEAGRPDGVVVALSLHFPKSYTASLEGCNVSISGRWAGTYHVIGNPMPYQDNLTPGAWNRVVEVEHAHG